MQNQNQGTGMRLFVDACLAMCAHGCGSLAKCSGPIGFITLGGLSITLYGFVANDVAHLVTGHDYLGELTEILMGADASVEG